MHLSLGCAIENLLIAAEHYNFKYQVEYVPDRFQLNLMAVIKLKPIERKQNSHDAALMQAMLHRRTARLNLLKEPLQASHWALLESCFIEDVEMISSRQSSRFRNKLAELTPLAYQVLYSDRAYWQEHWHRLALSNSRLKGWGIKTKCAKNAYLGVVGSTLAIEISFGLNVSAQA